MAIGAYRMATVAWQIAGGAGKLYAVIGTTSWNGRSLGECYVAKSNGIYQFDIIIVNYPKSIVFG